MTYKFHTRLDLINGGNIFRQDDKITLGYIARNANGEAIDFSGKEIMGTIYNRRAGIMFEAEASFDVESQKIIFTITQTLDHGTFEIEFVVTDPGNANYRVVVPSDEYSGRLDIKPSSANIEVTGVRMVTVEQLRSEQQLAQSSYEEKVDGKVQQLETGFTNHKYAVDLVVEDVQQKASAAETATQMANDAASTATSAASSANAAASGANEQAGAAQQAASDATAASIAANSSADRANTAAENAEGIVDEFSTYKDSTAKGKAFGAVDERFEDLEKDSFFPIKNILPRDGFTDNSGWVAANSTLTADGDGWIVTGNGNTTYPNVYAGSRITGEKYYSRALVTVLDEVPRVIFNIVALRNKTINNPLVNQEFSISGVETSQTTSSIASIQIGLDFNTAAEGLGKRFKVRKQLSLNLTKTFGAGNEPTAEEMDALLAFYPENWFDGTVNLAENKKLVTFLLNQLRSKASKKQEAWITPTLLSGWTASRTVSYYKDELGIIHLRGVINSGNLNEVLFTLPVGYRPPETKTYVVMAGNSSDNTIGKVAISSNGSVYIYNSNVNLSLDVISFRT